ncbi:hypothetical protein AAL_00754 [Moelleriella libera RCEF 2490]|uniref:Uncharacterized protein n=1 Tax=Moelleriella libera RCEF 2490 TaxID=1081109 RepID=A0A166V5I1_9HYPO|nr:hypothetical protein AAL_00754 [Moelleriella libera RCEF 2490]
MQLSTIVLAVAVLASGTVGSPVRNGDETVSIAPAAPPSDNNNNTTEGTVKAKFWESSHGCPWDSDECLMWPFWQQNGADIFPVAEMQCARSKKAHTARCGGFLWLTCQCYVRARANGSWSLVQDGDDAGAVDQGVVQDEEAEVGAAVI